MEFTIEFDEARRPVATETGEDGRAYGWTERQTAQALRDSTICKCGACACCKIRRAVEAKRGR